jgi:hypothetical protein
MFGQRLRIGDGRAHARIKRAHAAQQQPRFERSQHAADLRAHALDLRPIFVFARVTSAPAMRSEWPFRYFVAECMTRSAPNSIGRDSTGVATVESTASRAPAACAISAAAARSVMSHSGLAGVSAQTIFVLPGRIARLSAPRSVMSTISTASPHFARSPGASCAATSTSPSARRRDRRAPATGTLPSPPPCRSEQHRIRATFQRRKQCFGLVEAGIVGARIDCAPSDIDCRHRADRSRSLQVGRDRARSSSIQPSAWAASVAGLLRLFRFSGHEITRFGTVHPPLEGGSKRLSLSASEKTSSMIVESSEKFSEFFDPPSVRIGNLF